MQHLVNASPALFLVDGRRVTQVLETYANGYRLVRLSDGCEIIVGDEEVRAELDTHNVVLHTLHSIARGFSVAKFNGNGFECEWYFESCEQASAFVNADWRAHFARRDADEAKQRRVHAAKPAVKAAVTRRGALYTPKHLTSVVAPTPARRIVVAHTLADFIPGNDAVQ